MFGPLSLAGSIGKDGVSFIGYFWLETSILIIMSAMMVGFVKSHQLPFLFSSGHFLAC